MGDALVFDDPSFDDPCEALREGGLGRVASDLSGLGIESRMTETDGPVPERRGGRENSPSCVLLALVDNECCDPPIMGGGSKLCLLLELTCAPFMWSDVISFALSGCSMSGLDSSFSYCDMISGEAAVKRTGPMLSRRGVGSVGLLSVRLDSSGVILSIIGREAAFPVWVGVGARDGTLAEWIEEGYCGVGGPELVEEVRTDRLEDDGEGCMVCSLRLGRDGLVLMA